MLKTDVLSAPPCGESDHAKPMQLAHGPWSSQSATPEDRVILARLPLNPAMQANVVAGPQVEVSIAGDIKAYLWGEPYFRNPWLNTTNIADRWIESPDRVLETIDGSFLLLIIEPAGFRLINDKLSALTWYCTKQLSICL
jgi:hypothetical protein